MRVDVQSGLAALRTDLDAFSDLEAYALMYSGYQMTKHSFGACIKGLPDAVESDRWRFLAVADAARGGSDHARLMRVLGAGKQLFFKPVKLSRLAAALFALLAVALVAGLAALGLAVGGGALLVVVVAVVALLGLSRAFPLVAEPVWMLGSVLGATVGWVATEFQLQVVNRWYLRYGRVAAEHRPRVTSG